jgi:hypothetical protein
VQMTMMARDNRQSVRLRLRLVNPCIDGGRRSSTIRTISFESGRTSIPISDCMKVV